LNYFSAADFAHQRFEAIEVVPSFRTAPPPPPPPPPLKQNKEKKKKTQKINK